MILPIYTYGSPVLKRRAQDIDQDYPALHELIQHMWETMYNANGVGLAAPQIGRSIRLFVVDTIQLSETEEENQKGIKQVFINAMKLVEEGDEWTYEEGCLSIPDIRGDVDRQESITLKYLDQEFNDHTKTFDGISARVIQHEYDHLNGVLFIDHISKLKRDMVIRKFTKIAKQSGKTFIG